jgi:hypothetical protein
MPRISLYSLLLILAAWSADAAEVRLKSEAVCSGAIVRLKDVAEITSENENEAAALAELQLFPVPSAGKLPMSAGVRFENYWPFPTSISKLSA